MSGWQPIDKAPRDGTPFEFRSTKYPMAWAMIREIKIPLIEIPLFNMSVAFLRDRNATGFTLTSFGIEHFAELVAEGAEYRGIDRGWKS